MTTRTLYLCIKCAGESGASTLCPQTNSSKRKCDICGKQNLCEAYNVPWRKKAVAGETNSGDGSGKNRMKEHHHITTFPRRNQDV